MSVKKAVVIKYDGTTYYFTVDLVKEALLLVTRKEEGSENELIIELNSVPDKVQIAFYSALQKLKREHNRPSPSRTGSNPQTS